MATDTITIPNFEFSAFYYPQLIDALLSYKRINLPELTDESEHEPSVQFMRAFALVGHLNNVLIDIVANESTLPTAQLPETIRNMLRLIGYELRSASPSQVDIVYQLSKVFTTAFDLIPPGAQASTPRGDGDSPIIYFEALAGVSITQTNLLDSAVIVGEGINDVTAAANAGTGFEFFPDTGALLYLGNFSVMWDKLNVEILAPPAGTYSAVWEFYDGNFDDTQPDSVSISSTLTFHVNDLLGTSNRAGANVRVKLNSTGAFEDCTSVWDGSANVINTVGLLGQSAPSGDPDDYTVGVDWQELDSVNDGTNNLNNTGDITWALPQNEDRNWAKLAPFEIFYVRLRVINNDDVEAGPNIGRIRIDTGKQYVIAQATQGRSVPSETLGSSNGSPSQSFSSQRDKFISGSQEVRVDGEAWTQVTNFLNSESQDKHYVVELGESDRATIKFGDGKTGKIPPIGQGNIVMDYRFGAADDGNVGSNTVTVDKQGLTYVERLFNPRSAAGWAEAQSASTASLEQAKVEGPASLRTKEVAVSPDDVVDLTVAFVDSAGSKPFSRARAIEEAFGPKTVGVVCVARGGGLPTSGQLEELQTYFNGDKTASPPKTKHLVANQQAFTSAFSPRPFDVVATVYAPADVTAALVINRLTAVLQPEALKEDGVTYIWEFGGEVPLSRIQHEIFLADPRVSKVILTSPSVDTVLGARELPAKGNFTITMVATS